jgi:hypothetical protein
LKKVLEVFGACAVWLSMIFIGAMMSLADPVRIQSSNGDVSVPLPGVLGTPIILTCDSTSLGADDSSFGTFWTDSYGPGWSSITGYARVLRIDSATVDTIVLRLLTAVHREEGVGLDTIQVDTLADTGTVFYWIGKCENWTGWDSLSYLNAIYWECDVWDSATDSSNYGVKHTYDFEFNMKGK